MFEPLLVQMKTIYTRPDGISDFAGALLRPGADGMREMMKTKGMEQVKGVFQSAKEAGRRLVKEGKISEDIQKEISKELMPKEAYYKAANEMFEQIKKSMT